MLKTLKDLFDAVRAPAASESPHDQQHSLQLATAVLLVEVMRADPELAATERSAVIAGLRDKFTLADDETARLLELAEHTSRGATDYYAFTSKINEGFEMEQKLRMIEHMWRVAYADGTLSAHENHVMRKVAELLYIPHGAYVHAKMRAREAAGGGGAGGAPE
ncbi:TerB family tellurite resistance protein [Piscinibacter sp.]|uniref:tellurite resistance TerB family protein n=1 Tax=Piscinibacter sp. TaxID=1903157 RepID=UPI002C22E336|nr:TerB family tellurite resistance protein [Albitalea sp.]HUG23755.1 TerB family tellurite resistance protein [Albitalea sp.]